MQWHGISMKPPPDCRLEPRCPIRIERCKTTDPPLEQKRPNHHDACHEVT
jgi:ABC-type dipeptide/oligopeptide/nickel transport system ATPase component